MALVSPGVEVTIIDQSQYLPAASSSVPFIMIATAQDKADPNSTTGAVAAGTTAANAGKLYQVTSQRDLVSLFGNPFFYKTTAGTSIQGYELNEYGLLAAYSTLGVTNRAFVMRADIDLAGLIGQVGRPLGDPANGTWWLDTTNSTWGIFEFDAVTNRFINKVPVVVTEANQIDISTGAPLDSVGVIGDYAINQTALYHSLTDRDYPGAWYKNLDNEWVQVGSQAWKNSWPTVRGSTAQTVIAGTINIRLSSGAGTNQFSFSLTQGQSLTSIIQAINSAIGTDNDPSLLLRAQFADALQTRIDLFSAQAPDDATLTLSGDSTTWASLGFVVPSGGTATYYQPKTIWATNANQPRWRSTDAQPRPTGSVYFKTSAANQGARLVVSQYNAVSDTWTASQAPYYGNDAAALSGLDSQGGQNIPAGSLYTNYAYDGTLEQYGVQLFSRVASGPAIYTGYTASSIAFANGETVSVSYTQPGISTYTEFVDVTINGTGYANFQAALSAATANAPYIQSSVDSSGNIVIQHTRGGSIRMTDALSRGITSVSIASAGSYANILTASRQITVIGDQHDVTAGGSNASPGTVQANFSGSVAAAIITNQSPLPSLANVLPNASMATANLTVTTTGNPPTIAATAQGTFIRTGTGNAAVWSITSITVTGNGSGYTTPVTFSIAGANVGTAQMNYQVTGASVVSSGAGYITADPVVIASDTQTSTQGITSFTAQTSTGVANILGITSYTSTSTAVLPAAISVPIAITVGAASANITGTQTATLTVSTAAAAGQVINVATTSTSNIAVGMVVQNSSVIPLGTYVIAVTTDSVGLEIPAGFDASAIEATLDGTSISLFAYVTDSAALPSSGPGTATRTVGSAATLAPQTSTIETGGVMGRLGLTPSQTSAAKDSNLLTVVYSRRTVTPGGTAFRVTAYDNYYEIVIVNGGSGYSVGDRLTFTTEVRASAADPLVIQVTGVGSGGTITSAIVLSGTPLETKAYELSNWYRLPYVANEGAPSVNPANNTPWFYSVIDEVDIMINDADPGSPANWKGYRNVMMDVRGYNLTQTDPNGPIVSASAPTAQSDGSPLVYGDLWIDTSDLENYPVISRWENVEARDQWVLIDNADQATQNGVVFADARWGSAGTVDPVNDPIPPIQGLLVSNYLDLDAPESAAYPQGMLLFNTRRSGYNIKEFRTNYFNSESFPDQVLPQYTYTWVSTSGLRSDGSPYMGRKAQRAQVVAAMRAAMDTNMTVREEDTFFNLIAAPNYPELQPNMVALNNERMNTAYIIGDTPLRLRDNANDIVAWATNADNATSTGEDGLVTRDAYMGLYYPAGITTDLTGAEVVVPASHMMLRTILRNDTVAYPWFAPAGTRRGTIDNANNIGYLDAQSGEFQVVKNRMRIRDVLYENQINPLAFFTGVGLVNYGNKNSQETFSALNRTNVSRLVAFIRERLNVAAKPFVFEFNDSLTRAEIRNVCQTLLADILSKRGLYDYLVVCDTTNNTPARIDRNELWVDIAIEPAKAAEFIYIPVRILNTGEIAGLSQNG